MLAALLAAGQQLRKSFCRTNVEWTRDGSFLSFFSDCVALPGVTRSSKREIKCRNKEVASVAGPLRFDWYLLKWAVVPLTRELNGKQRAKKKKVFYILREFFFFLARCEHELRVLFFHLKRLWYCYSHTRVQLPKRSDSWTRLLYARSEQYYYLLFLPLIGLMPYWLRYRKLWVLVAQGYFPPFFLFYISFSK